MFKNVLWTSFLCAVLSLVSCTKKANFDEKILNVTVSALIKGMDPINTGDTYSSNEVARVYEGLLQYNYLKRPYELEPNLAVSMPEVSEDGLKYTFKLKQGVLFHDNKCFPQGKGRELKASDLVYSIKRLADSQNTSVGWWLLDGKIKGLNEWREKHKNAKNKDYYNDEVEGLKALDDYTLQFTLTSPSPQFLFALAMTYTYAVPKEAVEFYGKEFLNNPVGTGPFITDTFTQSTKIIYKKNPNYRDEFYPSEPGEPSDKEAGLLESKGQKLPLVDKIIVNIQTESQPQWLSFEKGKTDFLGIPKDNFDSVVTPDKGITDAYAKKGIQLIVTPDLDITYIAFNHEDTLFKNEKLRQAMSLAYNRSESNRLFYNDRGIIAHTPIPPGIGGYDPDYKNPYVEYDLEKAKKLLKEAGYEGGKGLPTFKYDTTATTTSRQMAEFFKMQMSKIGINIEVVTNTWPQLANKVHKKQTQIYGMAWLGDYPDAENFLQLIYGPNQSPGPNGSNFDDDEFNSRFEKIKNMQAGPKRAKLYAKLAQEYFEKVPWILGVHRTSFVVRHAWLKNYKFSTFSYGNSKYYDIDLEKKKELLKKL